MRTKVPGIFKPDHVVKRLRYLVVTRGDARYDILMMKQVRLYRLVLLICISLSLLVLSIDLRRNSTVPIKEPLRRNSHLKKSPNRPLAVTLQSMANYSSSVDLLSTSEQQRELKIPVSGSYQLPDARFRFDISEAAAAQSSKALHIIQFSGPIQDRWLESLEAAGGEAVHYIGSYGYLIWADPTAREQIDRLSTISDHVVFSAPNTAGFKLDAALKKAQSSSTAPDQATVTIQILHHADNQHSKSILDQLLLEKLGSWQPVLNYENLIAVVPLSVLDSIASLPDVVWIGAYEYPTLSDEVQAQILAGNLTGDQTEPSGPGYLEWLIAQGFSTDPQKYPIIDITDDGIGTGIAETAAGDNTFRVAGDPVQDSRIAYLINCTTAPDAGSTGGHGHINANIAGGYDDRSGEPYEDEEGYQRGMGINPFGRLAGTRIFGPGYDESKCELSDLFLVQQSYRAGARINSNSWGSSNRSYTPSSQAYDSAVRDADVDTAGNQEMLILFAAGNDGGKGVNTIDSPANGKNVIAVGASENVRPTLIDGCGYYGPEDANNAQDIAHYSGRGPAPGGRVKPDLVAPGTIIMGTASTAADYDGSLVCDKYYPLDQQIFASSTGTSHAVPAVAGFASLASYWLADKHQISEPSPALLKAFLVASSSQLSGSEAGENLPNHNQGFGLPNMTGAFSETQRLIVEQDTPPQFDKSGQSWTMDIQPADRTQPVRIVMAFTDQPGAVTNPLNDPYHPRVNDLDLIVTSGNSTYLGNVMEGEWSQTGGTPDLANTIEAVYLPAGQSNSITVEVHAANIAGDGVPGNEDSTDQDFALICDNCRIPVSYDYHTYLPSTFTP